MEFMGMGSVQRKILNWLNDRRHRDSWYDTRQIAQGIFSTEWASQEQIASIRQGLVALHKSGHVIREGAFIVYWHLAATIGTAGPSPYDDTIRRALAKALAFDA
jgi:hypothetical protein